jgi:Holliday junction resolvase
MKKRRDIAEGALPPKEYRASVLEKKRPTLKEVTSPNEKDLPYRVPKNEQRTVHEKVIQREIRQFLERKGFFVFKSSAQNRVGSKENERWASCKKGIPDLIGLYQGEFWAIEVKRAYDDVKISTTQLQVMQEIRDKGGHAFACHSVAYVTEYLTVIAFDKNARTNWQITQGIVNAN